MKTLEATRPSALGLPTSLRALARSGVVGGIIKLTAAALSFLLFIAIAHVTDERQFGEFGATYAGASLVSFFSTIGQQSVILRFWPQHANTPRTAQSFMARSLLVTLVGLLVSSLLLVIVAFHPGVSVVAPDWLPLCLSAVILAFALGWSEVASAALRAKTELVAALLPRDVIWRGLTLTAVLVIFMSGATISAVEATLICGGILVLAVTPQTVRLLRDTYMAPRRPLTDTQLDEFRHVTMGIWGVTSLPPALAQISTLLVTGILGPEIAGGVFVAERTARLVDVAQNGINQVLAPEISAAFHSGNAAHVQRVAALTALASSAIALVALLAFWTFGNFILGIFAPVYATHTMLSVLLIFSAGTAIGCACGPVGMVMQLTGAQHVLLRILLIVYPIGLLATAALTYAGGAIGAALGSATTVAAVSLLTVFAARRSLGIDPSVLGLLPGGAK